MKPILTVCADAVTAVSANAADAASLNKFISLLLRVGRILPDDPDAAEARRQLHDPPLLAGLARKCISGERRCGRRLAEEAHHRGARADHHLAARQRQVDEVAVAARQRPGETRP